MNRKTFIASILISAAALAALAFVRTSTANGFANSDLAKLRVATAQFHRLEAANQAGYNLVPGLDSCFENPGVGGMGFHYIDTTELNNNITLNLRRPEALVYTPGPNGLQLGAVEYIVRKDLWDAAGNTEPPSLKGVPLHFEPSLGVYILHAWVWKNNPSGILEDWNPSAPACPK